MPFNIIGACEATPGTGTVNVAFPQDDRYARLDANDSIKISADLQYLLGTYYAAASTGARVLLRQPGEIDKAFLKCCLNEDLDPVQGYEPLFKTPISLKVGSKLEALSVNATDEATLVGLLVGTGIINPQPQTVDEIIDGYSDTAVTALTWTQCPVTWNQDLKNGKYSVIGMRSSIFKAANPMISLARLSIPGHPQWKPGVPTTVAEADHEELQSQTYEPYVFWGDIGVTFQAPEEMPNLEVLALTANTDENVQLFLKKIG